MNKFSDRVSYILQVAQKVQSSLVPRQSIGEYDTIDSQMFNEFRSASLSLIYDIYGSGHPYYIDFDKKTQGGWSYEIKYGLGIINSIKAEIDNGWLYNSFKSIVSSEIFSDFIEMAEYLLSEKYKDTAAVIIGSVLEEHLRQLCQKNQISLETTKGDGSIIPKKADVLNADLAKAGIYSSKVLDQKNVTAWLDLRNKAAHGKYSEYSLQQVELILQGVTEFIARNAI